MHIIVDIEKKGTLEILRKTSGGRPSRQAVGPSRQAVGPSRQAAGLSRQAVGLSRQAVGLSRQAVGPSRQAVGLSIRFSLGENYFKIGNKLVI